MPPHLTPRTRSSPATQVRWARRHHVRWDPWLLWLLRPTAWDCHRVPLLESDLLRVLVPGLASPLARNRGPLRYSPWPWRRYHHPLGLGELPWGHAHLDHLLLLL